MAKYFLVSGGFDPIHEGHIENIIESRGESDGIIVLLNSDNWLTRKKGSYFLNFSSRKVIMENIKGVIEVISFNDDDNTVRNGLELVRNKYSEDTLIFAKGGDRNHSNVPEIEICKKLSIEVKYQVGFAVSGRHKPNSSSWILEKWCQKSVVNRFSKDTDSQSSVKDNSFVFKVFRPWGFYITLEESGSYKVKEITVSPNHRLSMQVHKLRQEHWFVVSGEALVSIDGNSFILGEGGSVTIKENSFHRLANNSNKALVVIEIQTGEYFGEDDIRRVEDDYNL